jgi:hypothetical protein
VDPKHLTLSDAPAELQGPIAEFWPPEEWNNAARISYLESGWRWDAEADTRDELHPCGAFLSYRNGVRVVAEWSIGYFQINACNLPDGWRLEHLWNVRQNAGTAHQLWAERGWSPWYFSAQRLGLLPA